VKERRFSAAKIAFHRKRGLKGPLFHGDSTPHPSRNTLEEAVLDFPPVPMKNYASFALVRVCLGTLVQSQF
jgi:hypothetical protein